MSFIIFWGHLEQPIATFLHEYFLTLRQITFSIIIFAVLYGMELNQGHNVCLSERNI